MALIKNTGVTPLGEELAIPIGGIATYSVTPLTANAVWSSPIIRYNGNLSVRFAIQSDVTGTYVIEYYMGNTKIPFMGNTTTYNPAIVQSFQGALEGKADGIKIIYTNGSVKQNSFYIEISLGEQVQQTHRSLGVPASATNMAGVVHSAIEGRSDGAGDYKQLTVTSSGNKNGIDVNVLNPSGSLDVSTLAKDINLTNGSQKTQVTNFPATQVVTASALPLPTGASTEATLAQVLAKLSPGTTGTFQLLTLAANVQQTISANQNRKMIVILSPGTEVKVALGFTASATNYSYRVIKDGVLEIEDKAASLAISIFAAGSANVNVTLIS